MQFDGEALLVSSSANRTIYRLRIGADSAPEGELQPVAADLPRADDFAVLPEGGYVTSTHADRVVRIPPDGEIETLTADPRIKGNTAVAFRCKGEDRTLIILGTGGLSEGLSEPGVVMELPFSE